MNQAKTLWGQKNFWGAGRNYDEGYKHGHEQGHGDACNRFFTEIRTMERLGQKIIQEHVEAAIDEIRKMAKKDQEEMDDA